MSIMIDLSLLPAPAVIDTLSYEAILAAMKTDFSARFPQYSGEPHDPITKVLEVAALRELLIRQNHNEKASQIMLAYAKGSNLDALAALPWLQVTRLIITPADNTTVPPTPAVMEDDSAFRNRLLLAYNQLSTAGSAGSYKFHALSADSRVKDAGVTSPTPGLVVVTIMSRLGSGYAQQSLLDAVSAALNADTVRPLTDTVQVKSVEVINYQITAEIIFYPGSSKQVVMDAANAEIKKFIEKHHKIGHDITLSGIHHALHQSGVQNVKNIQLTTVASSGEQYNGNINYNGGYQYGVMGASTPVSSDLVISDTQVASNAGITLTQGGIDV